MQLVPLGAGRERATVRLGAATTSLAFTPDGTRLAAADVGGSITLIGSAAGAVEGSARHWSQPIRWLEFSPDGSALFVATDAWLHALAAATPTLAPVHSRLVVWPASTAVLTAISATAIGFAGVAVDGSLTSRVLELAAADEAAVDPAALVARDWAAAVRAAA